MRIRSTLATLTLVFAFGCNSASPSGAPVAKNASDPGAAATPELPTLPADPREDELARGVRLMLESEHLTHRAIDDKISRAAMEEFVDHLDGGKLFLLRKDVEALEAYRDRIDDQLKDADLKLGRSGAALLAARQKRVASMIAKLLSEPFDLEKKETIETDPEKIAFAATEEELNDRWRRVLKLRVLEGIARMESLQQALEKAKKEPQDKEAQEATEAALKALGDIPTDLAGKEAKARADLAKSYDGRFKRLAKLESLEPVERLVNAITAVYDPHSLYLAPAERDNFDIQMSGSLEGIGAVLSEEDHYIGVREIVPGGASWRQGKLKSGDLILAVAQEGEKPIDVADMRINQVVQMIRGPKGTVVTLTVRKPDDQVEVISITRDVVEIEAAYARAAIIDEEGTPAVGYVSLPSFYGDTRGFGGRTTERNATDDLEAALEALEKQKIATAIIDLRGNGGGLLDHARRITGLFIPEGPVVQTRSPNEEVQVLRDEDGKVSFSGQVVVLVDRFSASASEIVAAALQDYRRAVIVGTGQTHGKGTVQMLVDLDRLGGSSDGPLGVLKLTIQQFFRINGGSTQWRGVIPDIVLPDPASHIEAGERFLDNAIPWSEMKAVSYTPYPGDLGIPELRQRSEARTSKDKTFTRVIARSKYLEERRKETLVPLALAEWKKRRERDQETIEKFDDDDESDAARFRVKLVDYSGNQTSENNERIILWSKALTTDPWVDEARHIALDLQRMGPRVSNTSTPAEK